MSGIKYPRTKYPRNWSFTAILDDIADEMYLNEFNNLETMQAARVMIKGLEYLLNEDKEASDDRT